MQDLFPLILPDIPRPEEWVPLLDASYKANHFSNSGPLLSSFENRIDELFDQRRKSLACSNATAGLQIVLSSLQTQKTKVIIPSFTFAATANAVISAGFEPIFVDIDANTSELDFNLIEEVIQTRNDIAAVMYVRSFGYANDLTDLNHICEKYEAPLIVDSASGFGGRHSDGSLIGHQGIAEVFSFHATKTFSVGEGGLIVGDKEIMDKVKLASNFGICSDGAIRGKGTNAKMSEFHAAIAHAVLNDFERIILTRQNNARSYASILTDLPIKLPKDSQSLAWQFYPIYLNSGNNKGLVEFALSKGYLFKAYYSPALHLQRAFIKYDTHGNMNNSVDAANSYVSLPVHRKVNDQVIEDIYSAIKIFFNKKTNKKQSFIHQTNLTTPLKIN